MQLFPYNIKPALFHMKPSFYLISCSVLALALALPLRVSAAELQSSDRAANDSFGQRGVSLSGSIGLVGAAGDDGQRGSAYGFRNLDVATGTVTQNAKLIASDRATFDYFGFSVSLSGSVGLVGAYGDSDAGIFSGSAYVFRNLDTATGNVTQNVKLTASDRVDSDNFGISVSLSGSIGIIGDDGDDANRGSAYVFRNLDTASGAINQNARLIASDRATGDNFGYSVAMSGTIGLSGAYGDDDNGSESGSAYVFRNLDTATGNITQAAKLTASDGAAGDWFGRAVSQSSGIGLVGAYADDDMGSNSGSAYVFRSLDTAPEISLKTRS